MILILVAVKEELSKNDLPNIQIHYTGVGKINAAIKTLKIIKNYAPSLIINYGTAGSLNKELRGLVEATRFFQRDMDATPLGFKIGQTPFDDISEINFGSEGYSCGTGCSLFFDKDTKIENRPCGYGGVCHCKNLLSRKY